MSPEQPRPGGARGALSVIVVGNDALVEALPALPVQVAHACLAAGYHQVLPLSWGDELVAEAALRALEQRHGEPAALCACPFVRQRLLGAGSELAPLVIDLPSPPVALARFLRSAYGRRLGALAFVGRCPSARRGDYDAAFEPRELLEQFRARGIDVTAQPEFFEGMLPPDRRRFASLPGGCPSTETLWNRGGERRLVELDERDLPIELAESLMQRRPVLVDLAPGLGCACSGVTPTTPARSARVAVTSLEPPRAKVPVIDTSPAVLSLIQGEGDGGDPEPPPSPANRSPDPDSGAREAAGEGDTPGSGQTEGNGPADRQQARPVVSAPGGLPPSRPPFAVTPTGALKQVATSRSTRRGGAGDSRADAQDASYSSRARVIAAASQSLGD